VESHIGRRWRSVHQRERPDHYDAPARDNYLWFQFPYETVPFFNSVYDMPPRGPRSPFMPLLPLPPTLPEYATWPDMLGPGEYPSASDWAPQDRAARLLKQHIDAQSIHTAMLGLNLAGADDPVVNHARPLQLAEFTLAFWGNNFTPDDLTPLDPDGESPDSGVLIWEDGGLDHVFTGFMFGEYFGDPALSTPFCPLRTSPGATIPSPWTATGTARPMT